MLEQIHVGSETGSGARSGIGYETSEKLDPDPKKSLWIDNIGVWGMHSMGVNHGRGSYKDTNPCRLSPLLVFLFRVV
jgi:hypothetical protein